MEHEGKEIAHRASHEVEQTSEQPLDKGAILDALFELGGKLGIDIEVGDIEDLLGTEDGDFMGNLVTIGHIHGIDPERILEILEVPIVPMDIPNDTEPSGLAEIATRSDYTK